MHIKLLGENENGFPLDCTVGKVYEIVGMNKHNAMWFIDDEGEKDYAFDPVANWMFGNWQIVDKNEEAV